MSVPAGAAAAIYAARKGIRTGVVAERFGGQVLDTMSIENFISVKETEGPKLAMALEQHVKEYDVDIMNLQRAAELVRGPEYVEVKLQSGAVLKSKSVILATWRRWREMNVPGEQEYRTKGVAYCPHCDGPLFKGNALRLSVVVTCKEALSICRYRPASPYESTASCVLMRYYRANCAVCRTSLLLLKHYLRKCWVMVTSGVRVNLH